jgi:hypothetical protein
LLAFADLRPESIGNFDGSDGLMLTRPVYARVLSFIMEREKPEITE